jgi:hypothetical protein
VAYLKFSRDKRGYEHFYLVQPSNRGKARPRLLYWFRTPPGVKVGRSPFDPDMRRALEAQNPGVVFDWEAITHTPIPPVVVPERWRERRRVERASRAAEAEESAISDAGEQSALPAMTTVEAAEEPPAIEVEEPNTTAEPDRASNPIWSPGPPEPPESAESPESPGLATVAARGGGASPGRRRRRRRGRRKPLIQGSE